MQTTISGGPQLRPWAEWVWRKRPAFVEKDSSALSSSLRLRPAVRSSHQSAPLASNGVSGVCCNTPPVSEQQAPPAMAEGRFVGTGTHRKSLGPAEYAGVRERERPPNDRARSDIGGKRPSSASEVISVSRGPVLRWASALLPGGWRRTRAEGRDPEPRRAQVRLPIETRPTWTAGVAATRAAEARSCSCRSPPAAQIK